MNENTKELIRLICIHVDHGSRSLILDALDKGIDEDTLLLYMRFYKSDMEKTKIYLEAFIENVSLSNYDPDQYNGAQIRYIYYGLKENIDVTIYANPRLPAVAMEAAYKQLKYEKEDKEAREAKNRRPGVNSI